MTNAAQSSKYIKSATTKSFDGLAWKGTDVKPPFCKEKPEFRSQARAVIGEEVSGRGPTQKQEVE